MLQLVITQYKEEICVKPQFQASDVNIKKKQKWKNQCSKKKVIEKEHEVSIFFFFQIQQHG